MKIGIDISQLAYRNTGVANYLKNLLQELVKSEHEFVLFYSSLRQPVPQSVLDISKKENVKLVKKRFPNSLLNLLWNDLHKIPIESFIGDVDLFITSDWSEPPTKKAKKATIIYDLIVYKYPEETHNKTSVKLSDLTLSSNIVNIQKKKLFWVKDECSIVFCISESTKKDVVEILGISEDRVKVIYPGC